jgi:nitrogen-specific signal transduction histidine kinase
MSTVTAVILDNAYSDSTLIRETVTMKMFGRMNVPAPREAHARLFVNNEYVGAYVIVDVTDNGPGVPEDLLPHLFDPFVTTKPTGSGLGLALVSKIIGDHGGIIECESQPRRTIFRVLMPIFLGDDAEPGDAT